MDRMKKILKNYLKLIKRDFETVKRILKIFRFCIFLFCVAFIGPYTFAEPEEIDEDDIEWLDATIEEETQAKANKEQVSKETEETAEENNLKSEIDSPSETQEEAKEDTQTAESKDSTEEESSASSTEAPAETAQDTSSEEEEVATTSSSTDSTADMYEQNLYETYVQYYNKRISVEEWDNITGGKDIYNIQKKDTLWDISEVLFNDPNYWPKLWSVNPSITNPHLIQPEDSLGFVHGTEGSPPSLSLVRGGKSLSQSKTPPPLPSFLKKGKVKLPKSKKGPSVIKIPKSLPPLYVSEKKEKVQQEWDINVKIITPPTNFFMGHYIADRPLVGQGKVKNAKEFGLSWHHTQKRIILEMEEPATVGQKMAVIHNRGKLYPLSRGVRGPFGYEIEVQGEVSILGKLGDSADLYEAEVTTSLMNPITVGAIVVEKRLIEADYKTTDLMGNTEAQIIGFPSDGESHVAFGNSQVHKIASPYSLVYLNRGSKNGLSVGQMYQIKANQGVREYLEYGYNIKLGALKILHVENRNATGLITEMNNPIYVGDYITSLNKGIHLQKNYNPLDDDIEEIEEDTEDMEDIEDAFEDFASSADTSSETKESKSEQWVDEEDEDLFEDF